MASITGSVQEIAGKRNLVLTRYIAAPIEEVWKNLTSSERLSRWIGHWIGNPEDKTVEFYMTSEAPEGEDVDPTTVTIDECDEPRRFACHFADGAGGWILWIDLEEVPTGTHLRFGQVLDDNVNLSEVGPGWEYYLDRMEAARKRQDVGAIAWEHYFPTQAAAYSSLGLL